MTSTNPKIRVLVDLRPALQGFAGIPQEVRLLFRGLCLDESLIIEGFLQRDSQTLHPGISSDIDASEEWHTAWRYHALAKVVISASDEWDAERPKEGGTLQRFLRSLEKLWRSANHTSINLGKFKSRYFEDFIWRYLFAKTLPVDDFDTVTSKDFRICPLSWEDMQKFGLANSQREVPVYPRLQTDDFDLFIAQTPYPGIVSSNTSLIIRYHDAIPIFLPHTIPGKWEHESIHFNALLNNVASGAWFSCVSESSRQELLRVFPEAEHNAVTIHNMVSPQYYEEGSLSSEVRDIIRLRRSNAASVQDERANDYSSISPKFHNASDEQSFYEQALAGELRYLLVVSTIDPRKNHATCLAAWQIVKRQIDPDLKLIFVGSLGWDYGHITKNLSVELKRGSLFLLDSVPASELRVLYRHAAATVCPSFSEGFDFSGVEAMRSGGIVVASDIAVHREVYETAAIYFNPYSEESLVRALKAAIYDAGAEYIRKELHDVGARISSRYLPENILPKWHVFLEKVFNSKAKRSSDSCASFSHNRALYKRSTKLIG